MSEQYGIAKRATYQLMPDLTPEEYSELKESIRAKGILVPMEKDENGNILDGHHREAIWQELRAEGVQLTDPPVIIRPGLSEKEKRAHVRSLNLNRRHLTREQRRELIADQLKESPGKSNRLIAESLGVSHHTVETVRTELEGIGQIAQCSTIETKDGRQYPALRAPAADRGEPPGPAANPLAALHSCQSTEWFTPAAYLEAAREVLGAIDLDPASCPQAQEAVRAAHYFTAADDGLSRPWHGRVWLNPPYCRDEKSESNQAKWSAKLLAEYHAGAVAEAVLLVNAATECGWFAPLWDFPICFTDHRIRFEGPGGASRAPTSGNAFVYLGPRVAEFARAFGRFGRVVLPEPRPDAAAARRVEREQARTAARAALAARGRGAVLPAAADVRHGDFRAALADLPDGSVDALITDPPYAAEFLPLYGELAEFAARVLKPGGQLAVMTGDLIEYQAQRLLAGHLSFRCRVNYLTPGGQAVQLWGPRVNSFCRPVLAFVRGAYRGGWIGNVVRSDANANDKRFHDWGQSESGMARLVELLTGPGDLVCDPFLGGGTTGVACVRLGRRFVGCDRDAAAVDVARGRLAEVLGESSGVVVEAASSEGRI